jgi:uncharacterized membrane protein YfcA
MDSSLIQLVLISFLIGSALGYVSGMLGIGGGLIVIPILVLGYGMEQQLAQGTALVLMAPNMVIGFLRYRQRNPITFGMAALLSIGSVTASYFAALVAAQVPTSLLITLVSLFMLGLAAHMTWRTLPHAAGAHKKWQCSVWLLPLVGCIGGFCAGFFTIGGGVVTVPFLIAFFGFTQTAAQGLVLAMLAPSTLVALATYAHLGFVNWTVAIPLAIGSILTISHGVHLAHKLPEKQLRRVFAGMLFISATAMLIR